MTEFTKKERELVDWYGYAFSRPNFTSGFGGWYTKDSKDFLEACPWVKDVMEEVA